MVKFRFSIVLLCVILPPVLYVFCVQGVERYAEKQVLSQLEATYLGDTRLLFDGSITLQEAVRLNIDRYLNRSRWLKWGGRAVVTVQTKRNVLIYPLIYTDENAAPAHESTPFDIATENYRLINEGLELSLDFKLPYNTPIPNAILVVLMVISLGALLSYYRHWSLRYRRESDQRTIELERLAKADAEYRRQLESLQKERARMSADIDRMRADLAREKEKAETSQEEMLEEIIALEEKIARKEELHDQQSLEVIELQEKLEQLDQPHSKENNRKRKPFEIAHKRFTTLYKNLDIHDRAVEGYLTLTEDLKLKCEEIMVQLNEDPVSVQIKRKVFGKKNRVTVLEVVFGYKGRLYFMPKGEKRAELITVGTKNSQQQDLAYLERL